MYALKFDNNFIVTASSAEEEIINSDSIQKKMGLVPSHSYSILAIYDIPMKDKSKLVLLKLRNPWGSMEWKGDWSEGSSKWTPEIAEKVEKKKKLEKGLFYMSLDDFQIFFYNVSICYIYNNYNYNSIRCNS